MPRDGGFSARYVLTVNRPFPLGDWFSEMIVRSSDIAALICCLKLSVCLVFFIERSFEGNVSQKV